MGVERTQFAESEPSALPWLRGLTGLQAVTEAALSSVVLGDLLPAVVMQVARAFSAEAVLLFLRDPDDDRQLRVGAAFGVDAADARVPIEGTLAGRVLNAGHALSVGDHGQEPPVCPLLAAFGAASVLAAPLPAPTLPPSPAVGVIALATRARRVFNERDAGWLTSMGERIAVGIDRAAAFERAERARLRAEAAEARAQPLIDSLHRAEVELRRQLGLTRAIVGSIGDGLYALDRHGRVMFCNGALERMLGWSADELRGAELHAVARFRVADAANAAPACPLEEVLAARAPIRDEAVMTRRDGRSLHVAYSASPVFQGSEVIGAVIEVRDVGARKRAEAAQRFLADATLLLQQSIDFETTLGRVARLAVPVLADWCMVDIFAADGTLQHLASAHVNPAKQAIADRLRRYAPDLASHPVAMALQGHRSILQPVVRDRHLAAFARDPQQLELLRSLELRSILLVPLEARGRTLGAITLARTESDHRYDREDLLLAEELGRRGALAIDNARLYEEAQRAVRLREEILAVVSHDLRNPLSSISVNAAMIGDLSGNDVDGVRIRRLAIAARRSTVRMRRLIDDLLDFASIEAGRLSLAEAAHEIGDIVSEAVEMMQPLAAERHVTLEVVGERGLSVLCDRERVLQVLSNLLGNAVAFSRPSGVVRIGIERGEHESRIFVTDDGPGIPAEQLPHIFDRYWRGERRGRGGAGLGLAIVKSIVEAHGGRVWAESPPGQGATFHFSLPRA
jgi:PAS domain S-box-containing protein